MFNKPSYHFPHLVGTQAKKYADKPVFFDRPNADHTWQPYTWNELDRDVQILSNAFIELGLEKTNSVAQFSQNRKENFIVDFAIYSIGGVMVPIYPTSSKEQAEFIIRDAGTKFIFVEDQRQYDIAIDIKNNDSPIEYIVVFEKNVKLVDDKHSFYFDDLVEIGKKANHTETIQQRKEQYDEQNLACILYTSGTSGNPKGVMVRYEMFHTAISTHREEVPRVDEEHTTISFLPLSHILERALSYLMMTCGATIYVNRYPQQIQKSLKEVRPTLMGLVPRFWEKIYVGVNEIISKSSPIKRAFFAWALAVGEHHNINYIQSKKKPSFWLKQKYKIAEKLVFSKLKKEIGIDNGVLFPTGGAKFSVEINKFFLSIGVPIIVGYGLTESTASVSFTHKVPYEIGTVGYVMKAVKMKIGKDNEILLKGKTITKGYYKNDKANQEAFTEDGWFRTGDAGYIKDGLLILTERIKDLFKTSNGKYIAPQKIETLLGEDKYIDHAVIIADERNYVTAIVVPDFLALKEYASQNNIEYKDKLELIKRKEVIDLIDARITEKQSQMANYEKIKKFTLIEFPFSIETGELTNTLKVRRAVVMQKYKSIIEKMYEN